MITVFLSLSILAITAGGLLSAFTARRTTRATAWASAYLVLVVGVIQLGLLSTWQDLGEPRAGLVLGALCVYNLANIGVMTGTLLDIRQTYRRFLVNSGGVWIAVAMVLLAVAVSGSPASLSLAAFIALLAIIFISMPTGLVLSSRRRHKTGR
jgi:hypothetical protein